MKNYTLYCSSDNAFCSLAESTLTQNNIAFETVNLDRAGSSSELVRLFGDDVTRAPQVFYGTEYVGNLNDLQRLFSAI